MPCEKFPSPPCTQGNGLENDGLHAIILLESQRSVRETLKRGLNDVRWFFFVCLFACLFKRSRVKVPCCFVLSAKSDNICLTNFMMRGGGEKPQSLECMAGHEGRENMSLSD